MNDFFTSFYVPEKYHFGMDDTVVHKHTIEFRICKQNICRQTIFGIPKVIRTREGLQIGNLVSNIVYYYSAKKREKRPIVLVF